MVAALTDAAPEPLARLVSSCDLECVPHTDDVVFAILLSRDIHQHSVRRWVCHSHEHTAQMAQRYLQYGIHGVLPSMGK